MYPIPPGEHLIETRTCKFCHEEFPITDKDMEFYEKVSPIFGGKKYLIPPPTLCPDCRQQRRLSFRNERKLYKRKCDATGKEIVSIYSPDKPYTVYHQEYWWSDAWDPMSYGKEFDFSRGAFEQMGELMREVPVYALGNADTENSEFANYIRGAKNCYLSSVVYYDSEDILYSNRVYGSSQITDSSASYYSRNCGNCIDIKNCENCLDCKSLFDCVSCRYCLNLRGCEHCIGCYGLSNKSYHIMNKKVTQEEYQKFIEPENLRENKEALLRFLEKAPIVEAEITLSETCTGNHITNSRNCTYCFDIDECEDCKYITGDKAKDSQDGIGGSLSLSYEYSRGGWGQHLVFVNDTIESNNIYYCDHVNFSNNCFGCTGLRNKSYCILNKQYTKEEYEKLVPRIIEKMMKDGEWGEFFPSSLSPFGYNETVAQEYYPLTKEEAIKDGIFNWSDYEAPFPSVSRVIDEEGMKRLPESIEDVPDDILNWALTCEVSGKPFRIIKQELEFYRKHNLPIPRRHPDVRHMDHMKMRNPRKLFERKCDKCSKDMITTYAPERTERVYCQECYEGEVFG